jgi:hypothetical protein
MRMMLTDEAATTSQGVQALAQHARKHSQACVCVGTRDHLQQPDMQAAHLLPQLLVAITVAVECEPIGCTQDQHSGTFGCHACCEDPG